MSGLRIENAIDMHCHFGPDTIGGNTGAEGYAVTGLDAAREAQASGHRAIVLKSHSFASPALAHNLQQLVPELKVFGGICTDYPSGGLNIDAVEAALMLGARIVWLPTVHSCQDIDHNIERFGFHGPGLNVVDDNNQVTATVHEIFRLVQQYDAVLATGHITAAEHYGVVKAFARRGKVLVTHAGDELAGPKLSPQQCRELAELGATIELTALSCKDVMGMQGKDPATMAAMIRHISCDHCTLSTDYGWTTAVPNPAAGLREFLENLWHQGLTESELTTMVSTTPARLLSLDL